MRRQRFHDWPERLAALVAARKDTPFAWGANDCCSFAADAALAVTGHDPFALHRGRYATEAGADDVVGPDGLTRFVERLMRDFGAEEVPVAAAQRGDWALLVVGNMPLVGVVLGAQVAAPGVRGLAFVPFRRAERAWGI
jgi:hypothetical protein